MPRTSRETVPKRDERNLVGKERSFDVPPSITTSGSVTTSIADCPAGRTVELITIQRAGHQWPGGQSKLLIQKLLGLDPPSTALNATSTIWHFFARHHK